MRSVPLGLLNKEDILGYCEINANATHPNKAAIISSQIVAMATHYVLKLDGQLIDIVKFCLSDIPLNSEYENYLRAVDKLPSLENCSNEDLVILCGPQPIEKPYFLSGINGVPSDSKYTAGCVLYILKHAKSPFDAFKNSILIGGDLDSLASITTGLLCGKYGADSLPTYMLDSIEDSEYIIGVAQIFEQFLNF
jgi:ADP-ribosylglycohydrolase